MSLARGYAATKTRKVKTGICSGQDAKNAKSGSLISLRPLRRRSGHALRLCARYSEFGLGLGRVRIFVVRMSFVSTASVMNNSQTICPNEEAFQAQQRGEAKVKLVHCGFTL
jgi:hypothetical protein